MKKMLFAVSAFALLSFVPAAQANVTCTAENHPSCTITCNKACGVVFKEPTGPCNTFCDDGTQKSRSARMSVMTQDITHSETLKLMSFKAPATPAKPRTPAKRTPKPAATTTH